MLIFLLSILVKDGAVAILAFALGWPLIQAI